MAAARSEISEKRQADLEELERQTNEARASIAEEANKLADEISSNILKVA
jgi:F0F1-type ATP synthase membrane subunit b/b'